MEILIIALVCAMIFFIQLKIYRKKCFENLFYRCYFSVSEAHEGDEIEFIEEIENRKNLSFPVFKSELTASSALYFADTNSSVTDNSRFVSSFFSIKGQSKVKRIWKVKCTKRGIHGINNAILVTSDIFGVESFSYKPEFKFPKITILPSEYSFNIQRILKGGFSGDIPLKNQLFTDPFFKDSIHEYTGREPLKFINHNVSARQSKLMVNTFEGSLENYSTIILDTNASEKLVEHSIRVCAFLLTSLERYGIKSSLYITSEPPIHVNLGNGGVHLKKCRYKLAEIDIKKTSSIKSILKSAEKTTILITSNEEIANISKTNVLFTGYLNSTNNVNYIYVPERRRDDE